MEELIKRLERVIQTGVPDKGGMHPIAAETVLEVVKGLSELSTNLAQVGTDCISRQAAIDATKKHYRAHDNDLLELIAFDIEQLPSAEPKRIKGEWVGADTQCGIACSVCGVAVDDFCHSADYIDLDYEPNFCPNCGADMRQREE